MVAIDDTQQKQSRPAHRFGPVDPGVLSEAIPAFFIGRNRAKLWVAREAKGRTGSLFLLQRSAIAFARTNGGAAGCATIFPTDRIELDLENEGNPFALLLASLLRRWTNLSELISKHFKALLPGKGLSRPLVRPELVRDQGYPS